MANCSLKQKMPESSLYFRMHQGSQVNVIMLILIMDAYYNGQV